jgi:hypothetical protein
VALALFADAGITWYRGDRIGWRDVLSGVGGGVHILLPYGAVARLEFAINNDRRTEWILDFRAVI